MNHLSTDNHCVCVRECCVYCTMRIRFSVFAKGRVHVCVQTCANFLLEFRCYEIQIRTKCVWMCVCVCVVLVGFARSARRRFWLRLLCFFQFNLHVHLHHFGVRWPSSRFPSSQDCRKEETNGQSGRGSLIKYLNSPERGGNQYSWMSLRSSPPVEVKYVDKWHTPDTPRRNPTRIGRSSSSRRRVTVPIVGSHSSCSSCSK